MPLIQLPAEDRNPFQTGADAIICFGGSSYFFADYDYDCVFYGKYFDIFEDTLPTELSEVCASGRMNPGLDRYEDLVAFPGYYEFRYVICTNADHVRKEKIALIEYLAEAFWCAENLKLPKVVIAFPFLEPDLCDVTQEAALQAIQTVLYYFQKEKQYEPEVYFTKLYQNMHILEGDFSRDKTKIQNWIRQGCKRMGFDYEMLSNRAFVPEILIQNLVYKKDFLIDFHSMASIAIALEFSRQERCAFLHDAGYFYPSTQEDFMLESYLDYVQISGNSLAVLQIDMALKYHNSKWGLCEAYKPTERQWRTIALIYLKHILEGDVSEELKQAQENLKNGMEENTIALEACEKILTECLFESRERYTEIQQEKEMLHSLELHNETIQKNYGIIQEKVQELVEINIALAKKCQELEKKYQFEEPKWERFVEYLKEYRKKGNAYSKLATDITLAKSRISAFVNSGKTVTMTKGTAIAIAVGMGLEQKERVDCIRCAGHSYPVSGQDVKIEELLQGGVKTVESLNRALEAINPDWVLTGTRTLTSRKDKEEDAAGISYQL